MIKVELMIQYYLF